MREALAGSCFADGEYRPGHGVPQWELNKRIASTPITFVEPGQNFFLLPKSSIKDFCRFGTSGLLGVIFDRG